LAEFAYVPGVLKKDPEKTRIKRNTADKARVSQRLGKKETRAEKGASRGGGRKEPDFKKRSLRWRGRT